MGIYITINNEPYTDLTTIPHLLMIGHNDYTYRDMLYMYNDLQKCKRIISVICNNHHQLEEINNELWRRYNLFRKYKLQNIDEYRNKIDASLPYIVVLSKKVDNSNCTHEILMLGRGVGIHLIMRAQSTDAELGDESFLLMFPIHFVYRVNNIEESIKLAHCQGAEKISQNSRVAIELGFESGLLLKGSLGIEYQ